MKLKSLRSNAFFAYLKETGKWRVALLLFAGIALLFFSVMYGSSGVDSAGVAEEDRLSELCSSLEGVGECRVMITYVEANSGFSSSVRKRVGGVTVLCEGAESVKVRFRVIEMICSMYDIGANRVTVEKLNEK